MKARNPFLSPWIGLSAALAVALAGVVSGAPAENVEPPPARKGGIAVLIATLGDKLVVQRVLPGGPADRAGIQAMDEIVQIGQDWITGMSTSMAISHLRGEPGTPVQVFVRRQHRPDLLKFHILRERLPEQPPVEPAP
jgi:S1-C subfamily serine protease